MSRRASDFHRDIRPILEEKRAEFLGRARRVAYQLGKTGKWITVEQVREHCPVPEGIDGRVMGCVFSPRKEWEAGDYVIGRRGASHRRPVRQFRRIV